jgi:hypothetical protein
MARPDPGSAAISGIRGWNIDALSKKELVECAVLSVLIGLVLVLSPSFAEGEKGGYWFFSRMIAEHLKFSIPDRSPLYATLLIPFVKLGAPLGFYLEYFIGSVIGAFSFCLITRKSSRWMMAICLIGFVLFARISDPPVEWYGMACVNFGYYLFLRGRLLQSFLLFFVAYLFRGVYLAFPVFFIIYSFRLYPAVVVLKNAALAALAPAALLLVFELNQSHHPLNNAYVAEMSYFPGHDSGLTSAAFIQSMNWRYNEKRNLLSSDFYFTQKEIFGNATTISGMIRANPHAVLGIWARNAKEFVSGLAGLVPGKPLKIAFALLLAAAVFVRRRPRRAIPWADYEPALVFALAAIPAIGIVIFFLPAPRYLVPVIPVIWIAVDAIGVNPSLFRWQSLRSADGSALIRAAAVVLVALSSAVLFARNYTRALKRPVEFAQEVAWLNSNIAAHDCSTVTFGRNAPMYGAFIDYPEERDRTIFALPPFKATVDLDCVVVDDQLREAPGNTSTNDKLRYDLYIAPTFTTATESSFRTLHFLVYPGRTGA